MSEKHIAEVSKKDTISRQAAIDALCDNCDHAQAVCPHYPCKQYTAIEALPNLQSNLQPTCNQLATDCISRQEALEELEDWERCYTWDEHCRESNEDYIVSPSKVIAKLPSAQPERKKGEWVKEYWNGEHTRKCSACNITQTVTTYRGKVNFNFCPYCGADMRGGEDEQN